MKKIRVGINGFGRIGKMVFRILQSHPEIEIVGINDPMPENTLIYLMKYDSIHGKFDKKITVKNNAIHINGNKIFHSQEIEPKNIPWKEWKADIVMDSSGHNKTRKLLEQHIAAGAKKVILSCPSEKEVDKTIIIGVNEHTLTSSDKIISNASCTSNCAAPLIKILDDAFTIETVFMNTVHPYTNNQRLIDFPHKDLRRGRSAAANIIPTSSSAVKAILEVMPHLKNRFDGIATRVPISDGAITELVATLKNNVTVAKVNAAVKNQCKTGMKGIVSYCEDPIVSSDIIGNPHSCIFDSLSTKVINNNTIQVLSWYDNEFGYSNRIVDLILMISA